MYIPDHPVIRNYELTGYPEGREPLRPVCPVCGEECETIYKSAGSVVGCNVCIDAVDAADFCSEEKEEPYAD